MRRVENKADSNRFVRKNLWHLSREAQPVSLSREGNRIGRADACTNGYTQSCVGENYLITVAPAATAASATAIPAISPAATATTAALRLWASFIHIDRSSANRRPVQRRDRLFAIFITCHLHETKTAGASRVSICHDAYAIHLSKGLKHLPQFIFVRVKTQIAHKDILHVSPLH